MQLEAGDVATPFEHEDIGTTLAKCSRYYQIIDYYFDSGTQNSATDVSYYRPFIFPVPMRAAPTMVATAYNSNSGNAITRRTATTVNGWIMQGSSPTSAYVRGNHANLYNMMYGRGSFKAEL